MKVISILNRQQTKGKYNTEPSLTAPDQTMSIREILVRHAKGLPVADEKIPLWDEDETSQGINPKTLDLVDLQELAMKTADDVSSLKDKIEKSKTKTKKVEYIKPIDEENPL